MRNTIICKYHKLKKTCIRLLSQSNIGISLLKGKDYLYKELTSFQPNLNEFKLLGKKNFF